MNRNLGIHNFHISFSKCQRFALSTVATTKTEDFFTKWRMRMYVTTRIQRVQTTTQIVIPSPKSRSSCAETILIIKSALTDPNASLPMVSKNSYWTQISPRILEQRNAKCSSRKDIASLDKDATSSTKWLKNRAAKELSFFTFGNSSLKWLSWAKTGQLFSNWMFKGSNQ